MTYLDKDGREMQPAKRPIFVREPSTAMSFIRIAKYVRCNKESVLGLIWIGNCEGCKFFGGHVKYKGIICNVLKSK
jgi:hypothetical protein